MKIVQMDKSHIKEILMLEKQCFNLDAWSLECFINELSNKNSLYITVLNEDNKVLGYAGSRTMFEEAELVNICVAPYARRKGIAKQMLEYYMTIWGKKKIERAFLEVRVSNIPAIYLYKQFGFEIISVREAYYRNNENAYVMKLDLNKMQNI